MPAPQSAPRASEVQGADPRPETPEEARRRLDVPLSPVARAALEAGMESARRGEIKPWGSFAQYLDDNDD